MKVNFDDKRNYILMSTVAVGDTFLVSRRSDPQEKGLYLKVDFNKNIFAPLQNREITAAAVNLSTGLVRFFSGKEKVELVATEVNFL